jgi:hypothetical protein
VNSSIVFLKSYGLTALSIDRVHVYRVDDL